MTDNLDYTVHYKKWHSDDPKHIQDMIRFHLKTIKDFLPSNLDSRVLDVGCGMGFALLAVESVGFSNIEGIEIDEGQVQSCLDKGLKVDLVDNTNKYLTTNKDLYDLILCLDVIEHIPHDNQIQFAEGLFAALKPGGRLICTVPNANSDIAGRWRYIDWTHHISFTESSLSFVLESAGFQQVIIMEADPYIRYFGHNEEIKETVRMFIKSITRTQRRLSMLAELGLDEGWTIPLSVNLLGIASK